MVCEFKSTFAAREFTQVYESACEKGIITVPAQW